MNAALATKLRSLAEQGFVAESACGAAMVRELRRLQEAGLVARERGGGGWRYVVRNPEALRDVLGRRLPTTDGSDVGRVAGVARYRDSKAVPNDTPPVVVVTRAFRDVLLAPGGEACTATDATMQHGVFAFVLGPGTAYRVAGSVALVENPALLLRFGELGLGVDMAISTHGRAHGRIIEWLAAQDHPGFRALHLPDYDPTGLLEFQKLRQALGSRVSLHRPDDLAGRFARYSSRRLLDGLQSRENLARLRSSPWPEVREVVALMDLHNAGLEQESLLVPLDASAWGGQKDPAGAGP